MQYGSEIWGLSEAAQYCERLHTYALKKFLSVNIRTPNDLVYTELNRYPITINSVVNTVRFWLRITSMDSARIPFKSYLMLKHLDERDKKTWVTNIRLCLFQNGFGYVWENQSVGNIKEFLNVFKRRLIDCRWQQCNDHMQNSERFEMYNTYRSFLETPEYLKLNINKELKYIMCKFRFGVSDIALHSLRYSKSTQNDLLCPMCKNCTEDEVHFVLSCPYLYELRKDYISEKYYRFPNRFRLSLLLASRNEEIVRKLCIFLYKAFKLRSIVMS